MSSMTGSSIDGESELVVQLSSGTKQRDSQRVCRRERRDKRRNGEDWFRMRGTISQQIHGYGVTEFHLGSSVPIWVIQLSRDTPLTVVRAGVNRKVWPVPAAK